MLLTSTITSSLTLAFLLLGNSISWVSKTVEAAVRMVHQGVDRQDAASIQTAPIKQGLLVHGRFGNGLDVQGAFYSAEGKAVYQDPPLTVECWAKLRSSIGSNMLVVNSSVQSPRHWEIYSQA